MVLSLRQIMRRMERIVCRVALVAGLVIGSLFVAEYRVYHSHQNKPQGDNVESKNILPIEVVKTVKKPQMNKKPTKTIQQIDSSKSTKLDFLKSQAETQAKRKEILRRTCERRNIQAAPEPSKYTKQHIYVVDKYKVLFCFVPKVGCSNWKRILMVLNGERESVEGLTSDEVHRRAQLKFLNSYNPNQLPHLLDNYRKFFFVREPFGRVLSVYRNKFEDVKNYRNHKHFHRFGRQIVSKFKKKPSAHDRRTGENVTWTEFVDYLTHPVERAEVEKDTHFSDHWKAMHKLCSPCTIDYDVIGNLETVADDAQYVLDMLKAPSKVRYLSSANSRPTNSSDSGTLNKYFSQLSKLQLTKLWDLYKLDYELFGYRKPEFVPS